MKPTYSVKPICIFFNNCRINISDVLSNKLRINVVQTGYLLEYTFVLSTRTRGSLSLSRPLRFSDTFLLAFVIYDKGNILVEIKPRGASKKTECVITFKRIPTYKPYFWKSNILPNEG